MSARNSASILVWTKTRNQIEATHQPAEAGKHDALYNPL
jgi:hypothetical protein